MYVNLEKFNSEEDMIKFINKYKIHYDDILYVLRENKENVILLIWY